MNLRSGPWLYAIALLTAIGAASCGGGSKVTAPVHASGELNSGDFGGGASFEHRFLTSGTFPSSPDLSLLPPRTNPARVSMTLRYALPRGADVRLAIFDLSGRRIRSLVSEPQAAGEHVVDWDLRDEQGRAVNASVYFARLDVEHRTLTRTLATVR